MEAVRNLKVNLKLEAKPCGGCQVPFTLGEDAAVCAACEAPQHSRCWEARGGCSTAGCVNAPLKQLEQAAAPAVSSPFPQGFAPAAQAFSPLAAGMMSCPSCRNVISMGTGLCPFCNAVTSPDGIYHGPMTNAPGAVQSLVYGIVGFFICGIIAGPIAISKSSSAKREIASNPTYTGGGLATAGLILGILDIVAWAIIMLAKMSKT